MKKWILCILLSFSIFSYNTNTLKAVDTGKLLELAYKILDIGFGNGIIKLCVEAFGCDEYEDTSFTDQITGLFSSDEKIKKCSANSIVRNITRIAGLGLPLANMAGQGIECLQVFFEKDGAEKKATQYHLCLDNKEDGHPLPLTNKQIAKLLWMSGEFPTVGNITKQYKKLCLQKNGDEKSTKFYGEGDSVDNIYIQHAQGYAYVLCASVVSACPCIFNVSRGKLFEPEYVKDDNGVIKMRTDGSLIFANIPASKVKGDDTETFKENEKYYKERYAKHCRIIRYKEVYEQSNDLSSIFDEACFDMHGYSKYSANITAGIVQCFENTARNIFEKPIMSVKIQKHADKDAFKWYQSDYDLIIDKLTQIKNKLSNKYTLTEAQQSSIQLSRQERKEILEIMQSLWFGKKTTMRVEYSCKPKIEAIGNTTTIYDKYIEHVSSKSSKYCCENDTKINNSKTCFGDTYTKSINIITPEITEEQTELTLESLYDEFTRIQELLEHVKYLKNKYAIAEAYLMSDDPDYGLSLTLFDILRNRLKVIATIALVLWFVLLGWKLINGDAGEMNPKSIAEMALKIFFCYMVVFSEEAKNYIFNLSIQTAQGIGMGINKTMEGFRSQNDNKYNKHCTFGNSNYIENPSERSGALIRVAGEGYNGQEKEVEREKHYTCQKWETLGNVVNDNGELEKKCIEQGIVCDMKDQNGNEYYNLQCLEYFTDYNEQKSNVCKIGNCISNDGKKYISGFLRATGNKRDPDVYEEVKMNSCIRSKKEDGSYYEFSKYQGCSKYQTKYGVTYCIEHKCKDVDLVCYDKDGKESPKMQKECKKYKILPDGTKGECMQYICKVKNDIFLAMPPFERPYKRVGYYGRNKEGKAIMMYYQPRCHKDVKEGKKVIYSPTDPYAVVKFSSFLHDYVYVCPSTDSNGNSLEGYVMDDGFRITEYIDHGIIENSNNSILVFQNLLSDEDQQETDSKKIDLLYQTPVRTAVATIDQNGFVEEYNFIDQNKANEGFQRAKYRTYLRNSVVQYNKKTNAYPKIKKYGVTRNYSHIAFWDSMDCKIIQFISMQGFDSGMTEDVEGAISGAINGNSSQLINSALNGMLQFLKFMFMCFPFGILAFILMFALGAMLFLLVARAAQQYCVCVFNIVLLVYMSPFVFVLYLFEQTKDAMSSWLDDLKNNIAGSCIPFISISMFLFIIDYILFGDSAKYAEMNLFTTTGAVNPECYEDHLNDAPIACLSKRLLTSFSIWGNIMSLVTGNWNGIFKADTWVMMGYLVLRALFGVGLIMSMTSIMDKMEQAIYKVIGQKPEGIGIGFEGSVKDSIQSGAMAGLSAGKFALGAMGVTAKLGAQALAAIPIVRKFVQSAVNFARSAAQFIVAIPGIVYNLIKKQIDNIRNSAQRDGQITNISNNVANQLNTNNVNYSNAINNLDNQATQETNRVNNQINNIKNNNNLSESEKTQQISQLNNQLQRNLGRIEQQKENIQEQYTRSNNDIINQAYQQLNNISGNKSENIKKLTSNLNNITTRNVNTTEINTQNIVNKKTIVKNEDGGNNGGNNS